VRRRLLIINADGYGLTEGITRAIEECVDFGTVRSLSANVNFPRAGGLSDLVRRHPWLSVGCHLNPIVGRPVLPVERVPSLVGADGEFHRRTFARRFRAGEIAMDELRAELLAQIGRTRELVGAAFSHVDFHMGLHRLPRLYPLFLEVAQASGTGRIRTHRYRVGMESRWPLARHWLHLLGRLDRAPKYLWNILLRTWARRRRLAMPDSWVNITHLGQKPGTITVKNYVRLLQNLPSGCHEFVVHPAYLDEDLRKYSTYLQQREQEREVLMSPEFRAALKGSGVVLAGYRDIPMPRPAEHGAPEIQAP
jgi:predicted glycoside hydrolase/deacetylase ChbG (UPF0249 family)